MCRGASVLTRVNPLRYAMDAARQAYPRGAGLLLPDPWPLALSAAIGPSGAAGMFHHRLQRPSRAVE
jgi:hypothetical protein